MQFTIAYTNMFQNQHSGQWKEISQSNSILQNAFDEEFDIAKRELYYDWDGDGLFEDGEHPTNSFKGFR